MSPIQRVDVQWEKYKLKQLLLIFPLSKSELFHHFRENGLNLNGLEWEELFDMCRVSMEENDRHIMYLVSGHPSVTWERVQQYPELKWNFSQLSCNQNIRWEHIINHPSYNWSVKYFSHNPNCTWEAVMQCPRMDWNFDALSSHPCVTWEIIQNYPQFPWSLFAFCSNPHFSLPIVLQPIPEPWMRVKGKGQKHEPLVFTVELINQSNLLLTSISNHPNTTWSVVQQYPEIKWRYSYLQSNPSIPFQAILQLPVKCLLPFSIVSNPSLQWKHIQQLNDLYFENYPISLTTYLCSNPNVPFELLHKYHSLVQMEYDGQVKELIVKFSRCAFVTEQAHFQFRNKCLMELMNYYFQPFRYPIIQQHQHW